jgi:SAM-dependent methyltransferase
MDIRNVIDDQLTEKEGIWYGPEGGYWSNLERSKSGVYLKDLEALGSMETMKKYFPQHGDVISLKRMGGAATLDFAPGETVLDAGCMWGALSVPLARTRAQVIAVDQTRESMLFLAKRKQEEGLENLHLVCGDLKGIKFNEKVFDKVIVNGVLEWVPETETVEVGNFIRRETPFLKNLKLLFAKRDRKDSPREEQRRFLGKIQRALKDDGTLYLAIENRYDVFYFFGVPEPHCGIRFISLLPRWAQDILSLLLRGRKFRMWTYSKKELADLLRASGFSKIRFHYAFPDYKEPEQVLTDEGMELFRYCKSVGDKPFYKKAVLRLIEEVVFKRLKLTFFAPSFIVHAGK